VNAGRYKKVLQVVTVLLLAQIAFADSAGMITSQGNTLYKQGNFAEAINKYDQALVDSPEALEPKFNKADSYYRLDDLNAAIDLYKEVAAESKNMNLVAKAKYNLGNSYFQQGSKQKDSNLQKAIEDLETAIGSWRGVLDIEPENQKAAKNIEVARLTIKDLLDQLNKQKQQQDPNQPQEPNQPQQQNQQQQSPQQNPNQPNKQKQQQQASNQEPNQPQSPKEHPAAEPNQPEEQQKEQQKAGAQQKEQEQKAAPDATAQEILEREQRQRKERQILQRGTWQKVERDW